MFRHLQIRYVYTQLECKISRLTEPGYLQAVNYRTLRKTTALLTVTLSHGEPVPYLPIALLVPNFERPQLMTKKKYFSIQEYRSEQLFTVYHYLLVIYDLEKY